MWFEPLGFNDLKGCPHEKVRVRHFRGHRSLRRPRAGLRRRPEQRIEDPARWLALRRDHRQGRSLHGPRLGLGRQVLLLRSARREVHDGRQRRAVPGRHAVGPAGRHRPRRRPGEVRSRASSRRVQHLQLQLQRDRRRRHHGQWRREHQQLGQRLQRRRQRLTSNYYPSGNVETGLFRKRKRPISFTCCNCYGSVTEIALLTDIPSVCEPPSESRLSTLSTK